VSTASAPLIYRIANIEVDRNRGCLRREGQEIHLKPKPFQILLYLLAHRERLVTREELLDQFWKDATVTDDAIAQCIAELRRTLGDSPRNPLYLKTVPKRGYRFVGEVEEVHHAPVEIEQVTTTVQVKEEYTDDSAPPRIAPPPRRIRWIALPAILVLAAAGAYRWTSHRISGLPPAQAGKRQVAVLRFQNRSGQSDLDWLRDGLPDMLTATLSRSRGLDVLSREQVSLWHGQDSDGGLSGALEIARRSHIEAAVLGAFARLGEHIRIDVRVYDVHSGRMLAAEGITVEKPDEILNHVDFLGGRVTARLSPGTAVEDRRMLSTLKTNSLEAYRYYSVGMEKAEGLHTAEAIDYFQKAISLDPNFAMAYARIGYAYAVTDVRGAEAVPYLEKAFQMADKLSEKDRRHISAWYAIANRDYQAAIRAYSEIIAAYPNETEAYHRLAILLRGESRHEEAAQVLRQAQAIDPEDPTLYNGASVIYSEMGLHAEAVRMGERYVALAPGDANAYDTLALACHWAGLWDRAEAGFNRALALKPQFEIAAMHRAILYRDMGREREARDEFLRRAKTAATAKERSRFWGYAAWHYWRRGDAAAGRAAMADSLREWPPGFWHPASLWISRPGVQPELTPIPGRGSRHGLREQYFYLAQADRLKANQNQMIVHLREALHYRPMWSDPEPLEDALADAYVEMGRLDEAIAEYERALKLFPGMALARYHLAQTELRRGRAAEAKVQFRRFLDLWKQADPNLPELRVAQNKLR
jgi:DNA-binding winged helix-turn-helix (wHTH) protein/tetratricopeptide (TPR) repeat protein